MGKILRKMSIYTKGQSICPWLIVHETNKTKFFRAFEMCQAVTKHRLTVFTLNALRNCLEVLWMENAFKRKQIINE